MAQAMREVAWSETTLGPMETWSPSLRTSLTICLTSRFPMLLWWGRELTMLYNDAYARILGDKHPDALGASGPDVWPEIWDVIGPMLDHVLNEGEATWSDDQLLVLHRHGYAEECYFTFSYSPIHEEDGTVAGVFTAVTETTERVLMDRRLRTLGLLSERTRDASSVEEVGAAAVEALAQLPEDLPFALLYLDDGEECARLLGACGVGAADPPEVIDLDAGPVAWSLDTVIRDGEALVVRPGDAPHPAVDDADVVPERALVQPVLDAATGEACGALVAGLSPRRPYDDEYRDFLRLVAEQTAKGIVDARAAESERERAAALAELNQAKTRFFSNVSHEFRTPLTLLQGPVAEALTDVDHPLDGTQRRRMEMVKRNADRMGKLVNTLLDFSRLESGRVDASYRASDLAVLTRELASVFPSAVERLGLRYEIAIDTLPQDVHVDREMWEKIVFNLLSNAIKFTFDGHIAVRLSDAGDHAELEVEDTGVGIPEEELPHLFERFHRVRDTRARSQEGTGIGLALVRELVDLHGGSIAVDTELDRGTTFTIRVPYGSAHLPADQIDAEPTLATTAVAPSAYLDEVAGWDDERFEEHAKATDPAETGGARILVVDDNADMRTYLGRLLGAHWRVEAVSDGRTALAAARRQRPDLVLTDVMMPGLDGFELLGALRADPGLEDVPVVLLSARASEASRVEGLDGGADDYLVKPFTIGELIARVRVNLRLARQRVHTADVRARQAMLAGLSHEMQTPLAAILGSIAVVEPIVSSDEAGAALTIMRRQATQLLGLVQRFLDFSRFEAGREPVLQLAAYDPATLIASSIEVCGDPRIAIDGDPALPEVLADADRVEQILTNLCTNALKFSDRDTPVLVGARRGADDTVVFEVRDRGVGIPADEAEQVFDKFFRGRSGRDVDGTGLGLYVSRALAEAMGGSLTLRHDRDEPGSVFALTLPTA